MTEKSDNDYIAQEEIEKEEMEEKTSFYKYLFILVVVFLLSFYLFLHFTDRPSEVLKHCQENILNKNFPDGQEKTLESCKGEASLQTRKNICQYLIPGIEVVLLFCFLVTTLWAVVMYNHNRAIKPDNGLHIMALRHNKFSQIWFTISISIFLGGLIYAIFHLTCNTCEYFKDDAKASGIVEQVSRIILEVYSGSRNPDNSLSYSLS